jgi:hypothetical protein
MCPGDQGSIPQRGNYLSSRDHAQIATGTLPDYYSTVVTGGYLSPVIKWLEPKSVSEVKNEWNVCPLLSVWWLWV